MKTSRRGHVWPTLHYDDAVPAMAFLQAALGFELGACYAADGDPSTIYHAQLNWPAGGGVLVYSGRGMTVAPRPKGCGSVYLVAGDPDAVYARAKRAGARVIRPIHDEEYADDARGFSIADPEGNVWSVGSFSGA